MRRGRGRPPLPVTDAEQIRRQYQCRQCDAPVGQPCRRRQDGRPYTDAHADRHRQAVADGKLPLLRGGIHTNGIRVITALGAGDEHRAATLIGSMPPEEADQLEQVATALVRVCADARRPHQYGTDMSPTAVQTRPTP